MYTGKYTLPIIKRRQPDRREDTSKNSKDEWLLHRFAPSDNERRQRGQRDRSLNPSLVYSLFCSVKVIALQQRKMEKHKKSVY